MSLLGFVLKKRGKVRIFSNKKADLHEQLFVLIQIVLIVIVLVALAQFLNNVATDLGFEKRFTSIDLSLLTTSIFYAPGVLKHTYSVIPFKTPVDVSFGNSELSVKENEKPIKTAYWYLSDLNMYEFVASTPLQEIGILKSGFKTEISTVNRNITFYKTGKMISLNERNTNALQLVCPTMETTDLDWKSNKKVFVAAAFKDKPQYSDAASPTNRIVQVLYAANSLSKASLENPQILKNADLVIAVGNSSTARQKGSLVVFIPVGDSANTTIKSRKLACFVINELLNSYSSALYSQIMPVFVPDLDKESPLNVLKQSHNPSIFIDFEPIENDKINVENTAQAIYNAVDRYYGSIKTKPTTGSTIKTAP